MGKKLDITPEIAAKLAKSVDGAVDPNAVSVFSTTAMNTLPVNKRGLYQGAVTNDTTLKQMAQYVNDGNFVPMHTLHMQGYELPVGRVFAADVTQDQNGIAELQALFYLGNENPQIVSGVDNGSINEVSVGLKPMHLNCSACGWDYMGEGATSDNIYGQVCGNGHEIGVDGTHLIVNGMDRWMELSLVSLGAAKKAQIHSRTKALMGAESYEKLAASGVAPEATILFTQSPLTPNKQESKMDIKELVTMNSALTAEKAVAEHKVAELTVQLTAANTAKDTAIAELKELKEKAPADTVKLSTDLAAAQTTVKDQAAYVRKEADRLCVAAGVEKLPETASFTELTASIDSNRAKLTETFGGKGTEGAGAGSGENGAQVSAAKSFKTAR